MATSGQSYFGDQRPTTSGGPASPVRLPRVSAPMAPTALLMMVRRVKWEELSFIANPRLADRSGSTNQISIYHLMVYAKASFAREWCRVRATATLGRLLDRQAPT